MRTIRAPMIRQTGVSEKGRPLVIVIPPPGLMVGLRLKGQRYTRYLPILDLWNVLLQQPDKIGAGRPTANPRPRSPSIYETILSTLQEAGKPMLLSTVFNEVKDRGLGRTVFKDIVEQLQVQGKVRFTDRHTLEFVHGDGSPLDKR